MQQIDIHTHQSENKANIQILNVFAQDLPITEPDYFFSAGLHPWHIGKVNADECFRNLEIASRQKNMLAIGECGIDRSITTNIAVQKLHFKEQIQMANRNNKPLIIHCVRAYSDLLELRKDVKSDLPWIIHGYRGNLKTTLDLIKHGFYFSMGEQFLKDEPNHAVIRSIPTDHLFLETDDLDISIQKIYLFASQILNIEEKLLEEKLFSNFKKLFGDDKLVAKNRTTDR